jgi:transposase-like protein
MAGGWIRCPHCKHGRALRVNIYVGWQREYCPKCHERFVLVIEGGVIVEVRPLIES